MNNDVELIPVKGVLPSVQVQSDNVIYVPQAHKNKAGIVKEGDGVLIENGVVSLNKQTVEDMIDANKWVSYGFQQNLTEDEKGMARHNIGAGDNYFTGSYYDLTQKPHLNTNNTAGLDYGDEELNNTINLHKISKTGSFNDLKHVPQETLDFAESERQKSKNLLCVNQFSEIKSGLTITGDYDTQKYIFNGTSTDTFGSWLMCKPIKLEANKSYTFSTKHSGNISINSYAILYFFAKNGVEMGHISLLNQEDYFTYTPTEDIETHAYIVLDCGSNNVFSNFNLQVQIEEGSVATSYQPYNGAIVHKKEIADVEHIETIYDMSSSDSNINWGNTAGIPLYDALNIAHDFSGFKKYDFIYEPNTRSDNWYGSSRTITISDAIAGDYVFTYFDCVSPSNCYAENLGGIEIYTQFRMAHDKQSVSVISATINSDGNHSNIASGYNDFYRLIKIVGYK